MPKEIPGSTDALRPPPRFRFSLAPDWNEGLRRIIADPTHTALEPNPIGTSVSFNSPDKLKMYSAIVEVNTANFATTGLKLRITPQAKIHQNMDTLFRADYPQAVALLYGVVNSFSNTTPTEEYPWKTYSTTYNCAIIKSEKTGLLVTLKKSDVYFDITIGITEPSVAIESCNQVVSEVLNRFNQFFHGSTSPSEMEEVVVNAPWVVEKNGNRKPEGLLNELFSPVIDPESYLVTLDNRYTLDEMIGNPEVKEQITTLIEILKNPDHFAKYGVQIPRGVVFHGPPGTGKTLAAKIIASQLDIPFYQYTPADIKDMFVGGSEKNIQAIFVEAQTPCVIFFDELDEIARRRNLFSSDKSSASIVAMLLQQIDGMQSRPGIIVVGATNNIVEVDPALLRGKRLAMVEVGLPNQETRSQTFRHYINKAQRIALENGVSIFSQFSDAEYEDFSNLTDGLSQADIAQIIDNAKLDLAVAALTDDQVSPIAGEILIPVITDFIQAKKVDKKVSGNIGFFPSNHGGF